MKYKKGFVGMIGLGYWGKNVFRNLHELGALCSAYDSNPSVISEYAKKFPEIEYAQSFDSMLSSAEIKAVAIATPAATHYQIAKEALAAGKDVFVEKPLALNIEEGKELMRLAKNKKRILMVGHILQYHPAIIKLKELVYSKKLGEIQYIYSNRLNIGKLRTEENILWSFAPHDISVILMLFGKEPVRVTAFGEDYLNEGIYDTTLTTLDFGGGKKGHIFVSWLHPYKDQKLVVIGSEAMAVFDDLSKEKLFIYPHKIEWKEGKALTLYRAEHEVIPVADGEPLRLELEHFIRCVRNRTKPKTDGAEGLNVLKIITAAENSLLQEDRSKGGNKDTKRYFVHESSHVDEDVKIGNGSKIWHFCHILNGSKIGKDCRIGQNVMIGPDVTIGDRCKVQNNVSIYKGITLEDDVFCGPSCVFTNVYNPRAFIERKNEFRPIRVKKGATIGANATIVCGTTIGKYAMVAAGAVVKEDVQDYSIVAGVPAKHKGWVCKCGISIKKLANNSKGTCKNCGSRYRLKNNALVIDG